MANVEILQTGILDVQADAIVNAANEQLQAGGGVCGVIFRAAGKGLQAACDAIGHCDTGSAVITDGFGTGVKYIIHAVGPRWGNDETKAKIQLYGCYKAALTLAEKNSCKTIVFQLISSGIYGVPAEIAWRNALQACLKYQGQLNVIFAVPDEDKYKTGVSIMNEMQEKAMVPKVILFHDVDQEYGWMSNWYRSDFTVDGSKFTSVEQYLMYCKAAAFGDEIREREIMATDDTAEIKDLGRQVTPFDNAIWNARRAIVLYKALSAKFTQNEDLKQKLLDTGDAILGEASKSDKTFAIGCNFYDSDPYDRKHWDGQNLLGYTLMMVRDELK